jgi:hypothetical protein
MNEDAVIIKNWIKLGIFSGFTVSVIYPSLIFIPMPQIIQVTFMMAWGPFLGLSAVGLYYFLALHKKSVSLQIALISQVIAGVLVTTMLLVQSALRISKPEIIDNASQWAWSSLNHIQLGIDVAWDVFIFLGSILFAINMYNHPKFGKIFYITGIIISILLIGFNITTFPTPPAEAGSFDFGPLLGLWGLAITINILIKYKWIDTKLIAP